MEKEQPGGSAKANPLLTTLLGQAPGSVPAAGGTSASRRRRQTSSTYDRITRSIGLVVALLLMAVLWLTGGYFTLQWFASLGVRVAAAGLAPVAWLLGLPPGQAGAHWLWAVAAWALPAAISAAEIGLWPRRVAHPLLWLIWAAFLGFDAWTTGAGVLLVVAGDQVTAWLIGLGVGVALALLPEKGARVIWRMLREG